MGGKKSNFAMCILLLAIGISFSAQKNLAQVEPLWIPTNGPPGGDFDVIEINPHNPDILYAGSTHSFFRSGNAGESWQRMDQIHIMSENEELRVSAVVFDPRDPDVVYVASSGGLFRSTDNGFTWNLLGDEIESRNIEAVSIDPSEPEIIYVTVRLGEGRSKIYKSTHGGKIWNDITGNIPGTMVLNTMAVVKHDEIYLGGGHIGGKDGYLYHSVDGGKTWKTVDMGQGENTFLKIIRVDPLDEDHIFAGFMNYFYGGRELGEIFRETHDGGKTWHPVTRENSGSMISDIEISSRDNNVIYYLPPLQRSLDGGKTWQPVENRNRVEDFGNVEQSTIAIDPRDDNVLYATLGGQGLAKSTDGGKTWWLSNKGLVSTVITNIAADPKNPGVVYAASGDGAGTWKTSDGGETWVIMNKGGITHPWVDELVISPADSRVVFNTADVGMIFKTEDAGETWKVYNNEFVFEPIYVIAIDPTNPRNIYAMNNGFGMFKSGDEMHFNYLTDSPDYSYSIAIDPSDPNIIYSGYNRKVFEDASRVYRSTGAGDGWEIVFEIPGSEAVTSVVVDPQNTNRVYAGATGEEGEIYASDNKGGTWRKLNDDLTFTTIWGHSQLQAHPADKNTVYAGTWGGGTYKTADGGNSWTKLEGAPESPTCLAISGKNPDVVYACDRVYPKIHKSRDAGKTWEEYYDFGKGNMMTSAVAIDPEDPDTIYASSFTPPVAHLGGFVKITGGEATPIGTELPRAVLEIEIDPNDKNIMYATTHIHGVYKSTDGGITWQKLDDRNNGLPRIGVYDIKVDPSKSEVVYAAALCGELPDYMINSPIILRTAGATQNLDPEGKCGIYKSTDGGENWELKLETVSEARGIDIDLNNPDNLFVADMMGGVWVSTDRGETWNQQNDGLGSTSMTSVKVKDGYVYASTQGSGVYSGTINADGSVSWDRSRSNKPKAEVSKIQIAVDPKDSNRIYASAYPGGMLRSDDGGKTWNDKNFLTPSILVDDPTKQGYYSFAIDQNDPAKVWMGVYGKGMFVSYDYMDFDMFANGDNNEMFGKNITSVIIDPRDSNTVYAAGEEGVFVTRDNGRSWKEMNDGLIVEDIVTLASDRDGRLYAGSRGYGIYPYDENAGHWMRPIKVENFGVNWHMWDRPLYMYNALLINPFNPDIMYFGTFPTGFFKTTNGGLTWRESNLKFTIDGAFSMTFHPYNKNVIYAGTYNGVSKSEDAGRTWRKIEEGMPPEQWVFSIAINPRNPKIMYAASKNGMDKGFCERHAPPYNFCGVMMKSVDGGETWFEIMNGLHRGNEFYQLIMYPYNYDILFVSSTAGVYMTKDAGESWEWIGWGLRSGSGGVNNVANNLKMDASGRYLYLGTQARGVYKADLNKLNLEKDENAIPVHCFNYVKDGDEEGKDCGGSCAVSCADYVYGDETEEEDYTLVKELIEKYVHAKETAEEWDKILREGRREEAPPPEEEREPDISEYVPLEEIVIPVIIISVVVAVILAAAILHFRKKQPTPPMRPGE